MSDNAQIVMWLDVVIQQMADIHNDPTPSKAMPILWSAELTLAMIHDAMKGAVFILDPTYQDLIAASAMQMVEIARRARTYEDPVELLSAAGLISGLAIQIKNHLDRSDVYLLPSAKPAVSKGRRR